MEPRCRSRADSRAAAAPFVLPGGRVATTPITSAMAAVTASQCSPGCGINTSRSRSMPKPFAASIPNSGMPTTPHQDPAAEGAARRAMSNAADGPSEYTAPCRSAPSGSSAAIAGGVGMLRLSSFVDCICRMRACNSRTASPAGAVAREDICL